MVWSSKSLTWFGTVVIAVAVLAAFAPGLHTPFQYDDLTTVVESQSIRNLSAIGTVLSPPPDVTTSGRPLLNLTFALDYAVWGINVVGYHATNIGLHMVCALLLFAIVRATARRPSLGCGDRADLIALATATIWAVHPLQTGAVTYISGRSDLLMSVWYLATLLAAIRAHDSSRGAAWTVASVAACAIGMACKESMATAPVAVLLYDRAYLYERWSDAFRRRWRLYAGLAATWAIVGAIALQAPRSESAGYSTGISVWTYLLNQALVIPEYFRLAAWPDHLLFAYGEARPITLTDVGLVAIVVPALIAAAVWLWWRRPALGFPALWVFLTLAPTSSLVPIATEAGAARRMYLPLAGLVVLFVLAIGAVADRMRRRRRAGARLLLPAVASLVVVALTATTATQSREFASAEGLWRQSAQQWPSALAHRNLAGVLLQEGRRAEGIEELRAAAELKPLARYSLGVQLFNQGRSADAIVELRRAILEFPDDRTIALEGRRVLARALRDQGRHLEAADVFAQIAALTPRDLAPQLSRADELLAAGDLAGAHQAYGQILESAPGHRGAMTNDGLTLVRMGRVPEGVQLLRAVAEQEPANASAYLNLATALAAAGNVGEALSAGCHAMAIDPQNPAPQQFLQELRNAALQVGVRLPACRK